MHVTKVVVVRKVYLVVGLASDSDFVLFGQDEAKVNIGALNDL